MCFPAPFMKTLKRLTQYHWFRYPALFPVLLRPKFKKNKNKNLFSQEFPHVSFDIDFPSKLRDLLGYDWIIFLRLDILRACTHADIWKDKPSEH